MLLRSVFSAAEYSRDILNSDEIILITKFLEPLINDYNANKLVEIYSIWSK